ncbi:CBS domain-containing protein [Polymorphobacter arshaanensis]|uniref:CBS domain-containing protein n=1 Tax=Glacieibacterium arshaanense TaxID=2511025 RepID=A0A4Y9ELI5_9SPHN|nr:CBS domain-containing protein [Polymorphobacter arshaanensis]TFU02848.1 CBS domain-containing protein [Polymorphobacter arshaanensis]
MSVGSIISGRKPVIGVSGESQVRAIVALLYEHRIGAVLVMDGGAIRGIVSERDIAAGLHTHGAAILDTPAADVMTSPVLTLPPQASIAEAMSVMTNRRIRHLPVVENGELIGLVSIGDLVKRRIEDAEQEALLLKDYIATA